MSTEVTWNPANVERLCEMSMRSPRPSADEIALAFGSTKSAIQTALSRYGITKGNKLADLSAMKLRTCMTCDSPFLSEGSHNRRCSGCKAGAGRIAA